MDGCAGGWVAVTLWPADPAATSVTVAATLAALPLTGVTGIDMPLGLLAAGWRGSDLLARRALGRRGVTVFAIPPRPVWECATYAEANRTCRELTGQGFSVQAWGLRRKIAEADEFRRRDPAGDPSCPPVRLHEVHPELAFTALAGAPLPASKHTRAGLAIRRDLLAQAGITLPARVTGAAENDLLDAAAVAWSARRIAAGRAVTLTNPAQRSDDGAEIAIRYLILQPASDYREGFSDRVRKTANSRFFLHDHEPSRATRGTLRSLPAGAAPPGWRSGRNEARLPC